MRKLLLFLCLTITGFLNMQAQNAPLSWEQKLQVRDSVFELLNRFNNTVEFRDPLRDGISQEKVDVFQNLFAADASIASIENEGDSLSVSDYIQEITDTYPNGLRITIRNMFVDYDDAQDGIVRVLLDRTVRGTRVDGTSVILEDTPMLTLQFDENYSMVQITDIAATEEEVVAVIDRNDRDNDGVTDDVDKCPDLKGVTPHGCPDTDKDGFYDHEDDCKNKFGECDGCPCETTTTTTTTALTAWLTGTQNTMNFGTEVLLPSGYPDNAVPSIDGLMLDDAGSFVFGGGIEFSIFFNDHVGIGIGALFSRYSGAAGLESYQVEYSGQDAEGDEFERILNIRDLEEQAEANYLSVPLLFKYEGGFSDGNWGYFIHAGPTLNLQLSNSGEASAVGNFEKEYTQIGNMTADWHLTEARVAELAGSSSVESYFQERGEFDVAIGENLSTTPALEQSAGIGALIRAGVQYNLSEQVSLGIGIHAGFGSAGGDAGSNFRLSEGIGELNSLFAGLDYDRVSLTSFGLTIGITQTFKK